MTNDTYTISESGKAIPAAFKGKEIPITLPDPHAADPIADALASGRFPSKAAIVAAANRTLRIVMRETVVEATSKEGATVESVAAALAEVKMPEPRVVDPNAPKKPRSSGEVKRAKESQAREAGRYAKLEQWIRDGQDRKIRQLVADDLFTQEEVDAARARVAGQAEQASA